MKVNFFLKDKKKRVTSVNVIVRIFGARLKVAAGVSVQSVYWNPDTNRAKRLKDYPEAESINQRLDAVEVSVLDYLQKCLAENRKPTSDEVRSAIRKNQHQPRPARFTEYFEQYYRQQPYSYETRKGYQTTLNLLQRYEQETGETLTFQTIDINFYERFRAWMLMQTYHPARGKPARHYTLNYFGTNIKNIRHVMRQSGPESLNPMHSNSHYKHFKIPSEAADSVYLSTDELKQIHSYNPTITEIQAQNPGMRRQNAEKKRQSIIISKNKFLIGAFTALRVSDFNRLKGVNIQQNQIRIQPRKGLGKNADVIIPIHPVVREIIESGFKIDTPLSEQKINKHIKEICTAVGITKAVTVIRTEGGRLAERTAPKAELVTTHTARRSGATNMYLAGIPAISIMKITGHRTEQNFLKYIRVSAEENARLLASHPFFNRK